jgi:O-antigen ligase
MSAASSLARIQELGSSVRTRSTYNSGIVAAALLLWWLLHIGALFYSGADPSGTLQATEDGSWLNRLQIGLLGLIGLTAILPAWRALRRTRCKWPYWFLAYVAWSALTLTWSSSADLGVRRFLALVLISIGAVGIGGGYYGDPGLGPLRLLKHLRWAGIIALLFCVPFLAGELSLGNLADPSWMPSFRSYAAEIGFAAAYALIVSLPIRRLTMWTTPFSVPYKFSTAALFVLLILLKSRALIAFTLLVFVVAYVKTRQKTQLFVGISFVTVAFALLIGGFALTAEANVAEQFFTFVARGDSMGTLSLISGRVPLWLYVWHDALLHPWFGIGFGSYWTPTRLVAVWQNTRWQAPCAHNGYLDEMAQTGIVGVALFLAFCVAAAKDLRRIAKGLPSLATTLVLCWLALFLLINSIDSILQFYFKVPFFFTLAAISSCCAAGADTAVSELHKPSSD